MQPSRPPGERIHAGHRVAAPASAEDLTVDGQVEGRIDLSQHVLTIGPRGRVTAEVVARSVVVQGQVVGNITVSERIDIREHGAVDGDIHAPSVAIADGAQFHGSVVMPRPATQAKASWQPVVKVPRRTETPLRLSRSRGRPAQGARRENAGSI